MDVTPPNAAATTSSTTQHHSPPTASPSSPLITHSSRTLMTPPRVKTSVLGLLSLNKNAMKYDKNNCQICEVRHNTEEDILVNSLWVKCATRSCPYWVHGKCCNIFYRPDEEKMLAEWAKKTFLLSSAYSQNVKFHVEVLLLPSLHKWLEVLFSLPSPSPAMFCLIIYSFLLKLAF